MTNPATSSSSSSTPRSMSVYGSTSPSNSSSVPSSAPRATGGYLATTTRSTGSTGSLRYDIAVPRVIGGKPRIAALFNRATSTRSHDFVMKFSGRPPVTTVNDSKLDSTEHTRVATITDRVIAGVSIYLWYTAGAAHPNFDVTTVVVDAARARLIDRDELFSDWARARTRLAELAPAYDPSGRLRRSPPTSYDPPAWIPTADGLRVYMAVPHAIGDYVPVTIPWSQIRSEIAPELRETVGAG
ncbi:hypothetical protein [Gordonia sp. CPCC 205333]|uniref:hypothetical protein n=1 Tax=Gordonia sp. CPCC 205333 TaxID=3140790 RepID=UPI003AF3E472